MKAICHRWICELLLRRLLRASIITVSVLVFSLLLLLSWLTTIAASKNETNNIISNSNENQDISKHGVKAYNPFHGEFESDVSARKVYTPQNPLSPSSSSDYDYGVTKYPNPPTFTVGSNNEYVINVSGIISNVGSPSPAINDILPNGMKWTNIKAMNWLCEGISTEISCTYSATVPVGRINFPPILVKVDVPIDIEPVVTNTVKLNPNILPDDNSGNDVASIRTIIAGADLAIEKKVYPRYVNVNGFITYTIMVTNYGPETALNVKVVDIISTEGLDIISPIPSPTFTLDSPTEFTWNIGTLTKGASNGKTLVVRAQTLPASNGKQVVNTATVSCSNASDWNGSNNTATASFIVGGVTVSKSVTPARVYTGEPIKFTINFRNTNDTNNANSVRIQDVINNDLEILSTDPPGCMPSTNIINCSFGTLAPLQSRSLVVRARGKIIITGVETITNTATVSWTPAGSSSILNRNSSEVGVDIIPGGTLAVGKNDLRTYIYRGETISYTINITNVGSLSVDSLRVTDTMSSSLNFLSIDPGSLKMIEEYSNARTRVWRIISPSSLSPGKRIVFTVRARVSPKALYEEVIRNKIFVSGNSYGRNITSIATDFNKISGDAASREIQKTDNLFIVSPGRSLSYIINIANTGTLPIKYLRITDTLPIFMEFQSIDPGGLDMIGGCSSAHLCNWQIHFPNYQPTPYPFPTSPPYPLTIGSSNSYFESDPGSYLGFLPGEIITFIIKAKVSMNVAKWATLKNTMTVSTIDTNFIERKYTASDVDIVTGFIYYLTWISRIKY